MPDHRFLIHDNIDANELVILNNLKPPFLSETEGDGVLQYGSKILIGS